MKIANKNKFDWNVHTEEQEVAKKKARSEGSIKAHSKFKQRQATEAKIKVDFKAKELSDKSNIKKGDDKKGELRSKEGKIKHMQTEALKSMRPPKREWMTTKE